jgi:threonine/homoserine/homoserine lactone efflux protein
MIGVSIGFPAMLVAIAFGAGNLLRTYPEIHPVLKWAGAAYLLYLAFQIARIRPRSSGGASGKRAGKLAARPISFFQAALFQWVNPKAWIIALGAIATYTTPDNVFVQALFVAGIFLVVCFPSVAFWTLTGVGAARVLKSDRALHRFNLVMAALLVASLLPLFLGE